MDPAAQAVLNTPELLEAILLELNMTAILISGQRVCRFWNEVTNSSRAIQEHLYFQPRRMAAWNDLEVNPLVFNKLPITMMGRALPHWESLWHLRRDAKPNAYMRMVCRERSVWTSEERFRRPDASWRRMLVVQPTSNPYLGGLKRVWTEGTPEAMSFAAIHEKLVMNRIVTTAQQAVFGGDELFGVRLLICEGKIQVWGDGKDFRYMRRFGFVTTS